MKKSNSQKNHIKININQKQNNNTINSNSNRNVISIKEKIKNLESENISLKNKIKILIQKEKNYISVIKNLKNMLNENELAYMQFIKDNKINEKIKQKYLIHKDISKKLNNENNSLYQELFQKNEAIASYQNNIYSLNEKINQDKLKYYFKEKEYENLIKKERRKLKEIKLVVNQITKEASETIKNLSKQFEEMPLNLKLDDNSHTCNSRSSLKSIQKNINQLIHMMSQDFDTNNFSTIDNSNTNDNISKLKKEISLLKYENNRF